MEDKDLTKIRGWLLLYVVWAAFGILFSIYSNGNGIFFYWRELPSMLTAGIIIFILVLIFYGCYAWFLYELIRKKPGIIGKIKLLIILTPIFNALLPGLFALIFAVTTGETYFGQFLKAAYTPTILGSLVGSAVMAFVWHAYFRKSRRVLEIWPNG